MSAFVQPRESGVDFDEDGPRLGPIRFLKKTALGFVLRPTDELELILTKVFDQPLDLGALRPSLESIARHMNLGDMATAAIATGYLSLPTLSKAQCDSAREIGTLLKASPDDPKHPGWPAGAPEDQGGQFRPKDVTISFAAADKAGGGETAGSKKGIPYCPGSRPIIKTRSAPSWGKSGGGFDGRDTWC